jgi:hypothetical protein
LGQINRVPQVDVQAVYNQIQQLHELITQQQHQMHQQHQLQQPLQQKLAGRSETPKIKLPSPFKGHRKDLRGFVNQDKNGDSTTAADLTN